MNGRVLIIAGSDSGGGAGIQADIKTVTALNAFAMTAVTALTAQNTLGVQGVHPVPLPFIRLQIRSVVDDLGVDAVKTGMLGDAATIDLVAEELDRLALTKVGGVPVVVDPVMVAKGGHKLLADQAVAHLRRVLLPRAALLTPNLPEAALLADMEITTEADMHRAATVLLGFGVPAVLLKGGHLDSTDVLDLLATAEGVREFRSARIATRHTHGTGCTLASAIAAGLAQGLPLADAVARARRYVHRAIATAPGYGAGHGPLDHANTVDVNRLGC
ncbi:MAG: bifunctional hydroxymethylpyrimidine kinase/phosphomethylpyrimidine kinase [Acetobacteraceae bacterium]|nr:bifunctional hydroxymethylpyrimidine kinase/phosphomethylpyrimidine kinase [Acetobacteraceae bacterium]